MARAYTQRFAHLARQGSFNVEVYAVPEGIRAVVRDLVVTKTLGGGSFMNVYVVSPGVSYSLWYTQPDLLETRHQEMRQALNPGDSLWISSDLEGMSVSVTGYELLLS